MKKNVMSLAVAATVAATGAQAQLYLNHEGTGQALIFPFYDAENGNATNFHVVNTTTDVVAAKVRFREYKASAEVLDFNLYLSAKDHFAFGVIMDPEGDGAAIITSDNSCTVPALGQPNGGFDGTTTENADGSITRIQPFTNFVFLDEEWVDDSVERTLRGYVEVIQMGIVNNAPEVGDDDLDDLTKFAAFATHGADGVPANCAGLTAAFLTPGAWVESAGGVGGVSNGISAPEGGLYGIGYHINVEDAAAWGFEPAALADVFTGITVENEDEVDVDNVHATPGSEAPNFSQAQSDSYVLTGGTTTEWNWESGQDAVTSTMMSKTVANDVQTNPIIGGQTDWVTTMPNKHLYTWAGAANPTAPFTDDYTGSFEKDDGSYVELRACEPVKIAPYDREEAVQPGSVGFSPRPPGVAGDKLCDEQTLVTWGTGSTSALNAERDVTTLPFIYTEGWAQWTWNADDDTQILCEVTDLETGLPDVDEGDCLLGLPVIGFAAFKYANGSSDVLMNYGHAADHKTSVVVSSS